MSSHDRVFSGLHYMERQVQSNCNSHLTHPPFAAGPCSSNVSGGDQLWPHVSSYAPSSLYNLGDSNFDLNIFSPNLHLSIFPSRSSQTQHIFKQSFLGHSIFKEKAFHLGSAIPESNIRKQALPQSIPSCCGARRLQVGSFLGKNHSGHSQIPS